MSKWGASQPAYRFPLPKKPTMRPPVRAHTHPTFPPKKKERKKRTVLFKTGDVYFCLPGSDSFPTEAQEMKPAAHLAPTLTPQDPALACGKLV